MVEVSVKPRGASVSMKPTHYKYHDCGRDTHCGELDSLVAWSSLFTSSMLMASPFFSGQRFFGKLDFKNTSYQSCFTTSN